MQHTTRSGIAPVKSEFLVKEVSGVQEDAETPGGAYSESVEVASSMSNGVVAGIETRTAAPIESSMPNRKRQRGMNKQREHYKPEAGTKMCAAIIEGRACSFGQGCRFSHDLTAYMKQRAADLGGTCPIFELRRYCRFGVTCRFGSGHLFDDGSNMTDKVGEAKVPLFSRST